MILAISCNDINVMIIRRHHRRPSHSEYLSSQQTVTEMLKAEVNGARIKISELEKDRTLYVMIHD
jgi:hypothetical protein